jgi:CO/xanthine dehydrogenase Mo-binding subunit
VRFERERVTSVDWATYPILTFTEVPDVTVRLRRVPFTPAAVLAAQA